MSIIHLNQIRAQLHKLFDHKLDLSDVINSNTPPEQAENFFLSRALAAYSVLYLSSADDVLAAASVTDGSNDNGIDAVHYDELERKVYLVQSKWIHSGLGEPENGEVKKFVSGVRDLFNLLFERFNERIGAKKGLILTALNDPATRYEVVVAHTGMSKLAEPSTRDLADLALEMNDAADVLAVRVINQVDLYSSLTASLAGEPINLEIVLKGWGRVESPHPAYYGQVDGTQVANWWNTHGTRLFAKNLRGVLGDTDVNDEIRSSVEKTPELFWYYNNGITLLSKKITKTMAYGADTAFGTFHCHDVSVVNGAQTVSTLGKTAASSAENVGKILLPFRVISLEESNEQFGGAVTKTNNRQNRIENRDFVTLDPEQTRIRTELAVEGVEYHLMRTDVVARGPSAFDLVESTTALACASGDVALVVQLKREIGKLWENISKAPYKQLFNPQISGMYMWRCVQVQRVIDLSLEADVAQMPSKSGRKYGVSIHGNRLIAGIVFTRLGSNQLASVAFDYAALLSGTEIPDNVSKALDDLHALVSAHYENAIIPTLFKNQSKCKHLFQLATSPSGA